MKSQNLPKLIFTILILFVSLFIINCADYDLLDTKPPVPPERVTVSVKEVTDSSVSLSWTKCDNDSFKSYIVMYCKGEYFNSDMKLVDTLLFSIDTAIKIDSLDILTRYSFRVTVLLTNGASAPSYSVSETTLKSSKVLDLICVKNNNDIILTWNRCIRSFSEYIIYSDTTDKVDSTKTVVKSIPGRDTAYTILDYKYDRPIYYIVYASNKGRQTVAKSNWVRVDSLKIY